MKRKTYITFILLIVIVATLLTGCKKTLEEKVTEKILESTSGADVDINKDTTTIKTDDGTTQMGTNIQWPKDKLGNLKELKANIIMLSEDKEKTLTYILFDGLKKDDADKYLESIKELGYEAIFENTSADGFIYNGRDKDGFDVMFSFGLDGSGNLSYSKNQPLDVGNPVDSNSSDDSLFTGDSPTTEYPTEEIDMTDDAPWPSDFLKEIPELDGKITEVSSSGETEKYIYMEYVKKEDALEYINKIKEAGFTESPTESITSDYLEYQASNSSEDYIMFNWSSGDYVSITLVKSE